MTTIYFVRFEFCGQQCGKIEAYDVFTKQTKDL